MWSRGRYAAELESLLQKMPQEDRDSLAEQVTQAKALLEDLAGRCGLALQAVEELAARLAAPGSAAA